MATAKTSKGAKPKSKPAAKAKKAVVNSGDYAVVQIGSTQARVQPGDQFLVVKLDAKEGSSVSFPQVLLCKRGESTPFLARKSVLF